MWPFKKKANTPQPPHPKGSVAPSAAPPALLEHPRYATQPMALFFEAYVLSVIGHLPPDRDQRFQAMDIGRRLKTAATEWRAVVKESLHLSDTVDVAILDLWIRNSAAMERDGALYDPIAFSQDFVDHFYEPESQVDVWPEGALEAAQHRIQEYRSSHRADA